VFTSTLLLTVVNYQPKNLKALLRRGLAFEGIERCDLPIASAGVCCTLTLVPRRFRSALADIRAVLAIDPTVKVVLHAGRDMCCSCITNPTTSADRKCGAAPHRLCCSRAQEAGSGHLGERHSVVAERAGEGLTQWVSLCDEPRVWRRQDRRSLT